MTFYDKQSQDNILYYNKMLEIMGSLSNLFSESDKPYIDSRVAENVFCMCLEAKNLARADCSADAQKNQVGIGIKTWVSSNAMQKIAEFNRLKKEYDGLSGEALADKIAEFRNARITFTMRTYFINEMIYHCIVRDSGKIIIKESLMEPINRNEIRIIGEKDHITKFTDGNNEYSFNASKSVLMKRFDNMKTLKTIPVAIISNPYEILETTFLKSTEFPLLVAEQNQNIEKYSISQNKIKDPHLFLRLYSYKRIDGEKYVPEKSGLNQWNADGRRRNPNEVYISISPEDHRKTPNFFPGRDIPFQLELPNGEIIAAKVCQDGEKALMSNPNKLLGKWLLREVFNLKENELVTYDMFERVGVDSVFVQKKKPNFYTIDFAKIGSYEEFMGGEEE